jgi:DNA-binding response OmpR family regulator
MVTALIIDNELGFMFWLGQILNEAGYAALPAKSASEAVGLLSENNIEPDLLIINPSLLGVVRLAAELRRSRPGLKVIASADVEDQMCKLPGIDHFLLKPVRADEALRQIWLQTIRRLLPMDSATQ